MIRILLLIAWAGTGTVPAVPEEPGMVQKCEQEIKDLHRFFEAWFNGTLPNNDGAFARFKDVVTEDFQIVTPSGGLVKRQALLESLRKAYGNAGGVPMRIWVENPRVREIGPGLLLATYEEWQERDAQKRGRLSTAIFQVEEGAPNGLVWRHVHEVWLPSK